MPAGRQREALRPASGLGARARMGGQDRGCAVGADQALAGERVDEARQRQAPSGLAVSGSVCSIAISVPSNRCMLRACSDRASITSDLAIVSGALLVPATLIRFEKSFAERGNAILSRIALRITHDVPCAPAKPAAAVTVCVDNDKSKFIVERVSHPGSEFRRTLATDENVGRRQTFCPVFDRVRLIEKLSDFRVAKDAIVRKQVSVHD